MDPRDVHAMLTNNGDRKPLLAIVSTFVVSIYRLYLHVSIQLWIVVPSLILLMDEWTHHLEPNLWIELTTLATLGTI